MSDEDVRVVRSLIDSFNRGELDRALERASADWVWDWSNAMGPLQGVYRGREEVRGAWEAFREAWDEVQWHPQETIDIGRGKVVIVNHARMRGKGSGVDVDAVGVFLFTVERGEIVRVKLYQSKEDALAEGGAPD